MEALDYDHSVFNQAQREADKALAVRFYMMPVKNEHRSAEEGRPIFEDTEHAEIRVRGDRNNVVIRPVREEDKIRFRDAYRAYKDGMNAVVNGTPLGEWPACTQSFVEEMKFLGFHTVEQLADASEAVLTRVPGLTSLKQKAKTFIDYSKGVAPLEKLQTKLEQAESDAAMARQQAADMSARLTELEAKYTNILEAQATGRSAKLPIPK